MYLTLAARAGPTLPTASDLGFLLHKHPARAQQVGVTAGVAHVFYPEASTEQCTVALLLEVDPVALVRGRRYGGDAFALGQYVNDRPYAASSMLAVALGKVFRTAMTGRCDARPDLVAAPLDLAVHVPVLPSVGGEPMVRELFEPLGWVVEAAAIPLDETRPEWGASRYVDVRLRGTMPVADALSHLYVLLPVLDTAKHYWVTEDEVDKLLRAAGGWLPSHPAREVVTRRYLAHQGDLVASATARLTALDDLPVLDDLPAQPEHSPSVGAPLAVQRRQAVLDVLRSAGATRVVDLGCGEGALLRDLLQDTAFGEVLGVDVSPRALAVAERRLGLDRMGDQQRARLRLLQSSVTYRDRRIAGYDAVVLMEVLEHLDLERLPDLETAVFVDARPRTVVVTTPNAEHNVRFESLAAGEMRHRDHRFEWTRAEFATWTAAVCEHTGYTVRHLPVGDDDPEVGPPTQLAVFTVDDPQQVAS